MKNRIALAVLVVLSVITFAPSHAPAQDVAATPRKVLARVAPQYSAVARSMAIEGTVKADVLVAPNGLVKSVEFKGGHPLFIQAARNALNQWRWEAAAHETHEIVELKFSL